MLKIIKKACEGDPCTQLTMRKSGFLLLSIQLDFFKISLSNQFIKGEQLILIVVYLFCFSRSICSFVGKVFFSLTSICFNFDSWSNEANASNDFSLAISKNFIAHELYLVSYSKRRIRFVLTGHQLQKKRTGQRYLVRIFGPVRTPIFGPVEKTRF